MREFKDFELRALQASGFTSFWVSGVCGLLIGSIVVPFCGLYLESYKVLPKRDYNGAYGYLVLFAFGFRRVLNPKP